MYKSIFLFSYIAIHRKGESSIRVSINDDLRVVQFWCNTEEANDEHLTAKVQSLYREIAPSKKYKSVIYRSGKNDLSSLTADLLRHNVKCNVVS